MVSCTTLIDNLRSAEDLIGQAADAGAGLVVLPEYFCLMGHRDTDKFQIREKPGTGMIQEFLQAQAKRYGIWLVGGTLPLETPEGDRTYNTSLVFSPDGALAARYDQVHLFSFRKARKSVVSGKSVSVRVDHGGR